MDKLDFTDGLFERNKIRIGNKTYEVIRNYTVIDKDNEVVLGKILYDEQKILISTKYPTETQDETLIHEIVHGLLTESILGEFLEKSENIDEEQFVNILGKILYRFIDENFK